MHRVQQRWDKVRGELQRVVSEGNAADFMGGGYMEQQQHAAPASEAHWRGRDSASSTRCHTARGRKAPGCLNPTGSAL
jgi:hypothetical protein